MMKWLVKKKSMEENPSVDMITEDPLATLELGLGSNSPGSKQSASTRSKRRFKNSSNNHIYSVTRTNPLFDGDTPSAEYKSSSETSGYSSRDQHPENEIQEIKDDFEDEENQTEEGEEGSTVSCTTSTTSSRELRLHSENTKMPYLNPDYVNRIIIDKCEIGHPPSSLSLSPIGEETEVDENAVEDSIVTNSLLAMTSGSGDHPQDDDLELDDSNPYIEPIDLRTENDTNENMDKVIRELSEAVVSSRNVLSLTRAMGNKCKNNSLSSNPYSYAEYKSHKHDRLSDYFRIKEVNGLQVVNLDEVPSMDPVSECSKKKVQFYLDPNRRQGENLFSQRMSLGNEKDYDGVSTILDVNLLNQQYYWESYYGLQREIVIDGVDRGRRKGVLEAAANEPNRGFFTNNFVLDSMSQPSTSMSSANGLTLQRFQSKDLSKKSKTQSQNSSKNAFYRLIKYLHNSSCFWKSFWIVAGFTFILIVTIATSIYVTKSIIQKNN
ncbi:uncharacterized protein [Lepeophtheirus salmonis]|uniref:uncharacterized protein n=1 Tax=Lepeophtheirus salmonis TaxID=72036 RepID=UPI001AE42ED2|nr:uncharacterized protein LOC121116538 [Lepeophtheirus salmonis]